MSAAVRCALCTPMRRWLHTSPLSGTTSVCAYCGALCSRRARAPMVQHRHMPRGRVCGVHVAVLRRRHLAPPPRTATLHCPAGVVCRAADAVLTDRSAVTRIACAASTSSCYRRRWGAPHQSRCDMARSNAAHRRTVPGGIERVGVGRWAAERRCVVVRELRHRRGTERPD